MSVTVVVSMAVIVIVIVIASMVVVMIVMSIHCALCSKGSQAPCPWNSISAPSTTMVVPWI